MEKIKFLDFIVNNTIIIIKTIKVIKQNMGCIIQKVLVLFRIILFSFIHYIIINDIIIYKVKKSVLLLQNYFYTE